MEIILYCAAISMLIIALISFILLDKNDKITAAIPAIGAIMFFMIAFVETKRKQCSENIEVVPTALDVYRGKTTLQITYENSIPVDTIVIFKKEFTK